MRLIIKKTIYYNITERYDINKTIYGNITEKYDKIRHKK